MWNIRSNGENVDGKKSPREINVFRSEIVVPKSFVKFDNDGG